MGADGQTSAQRLTNAAVPLSLTAVVEPQTGR